MPSLFSRSRTNSTPHKKLSLPTQDDSTAGLGALDEFGRVSSRTSNRGLSNVKTSTSSPAKRDKKKAKEQEKRSRTLSNAIDRAEYDRSAESPAPFIPDGAFLPLSLERPRDELGGIQQPKGHDYGYLSYERHVVLGLEQAARLVEVVAEELGTRGGITTPFIFSTLALDISSAGIKRLIRAFLDTCSMNQGRSAQEAELRWREEARFAGPHELGMCIRWGLARVVRLVGGMDVRGLIAWDQYIDFRDSEAALHYPPSHFTTLLPTLTPPLRSILLTVLTLLARITANSASSGHTPPTLSSLFGPLIFGLGPATLAFHHTYIQYLRSVHAMEHLILAFIRWQDNPRPSTASSTNNVPGETTGSAATLGVPTRLKEWIKGYPAMLPSLHERHKNEKPQARRGARTVRTMSIRRNVRMYSPDLVKSAATWSQSNRAGTTVGPGPPGSDIRGLATTKEWDRIAPASLKLPPRYSESYKKRMDMPPHFHPDNGPSGVSSVSSTSSYSSATSSGTTTSTLQDKDHFGLGLGGREGEDRFRSLTDLKWGEFETMGFGGLALDDEKKLQFDLTEGARNARSVKRTTLTWNDFSASGFSRFDDPLKTSLQFSTPVSSTISSWPAHNAEISKKLKKSQKSLPAFGWDTEPVVGNEEVIEEAFIDVFCDLLYGGGWMDLERAEEVDRDCNWALVEFKSLPLSRTTASGGSDPRTATSLILFEEFVPLEYRQELALSSSNRRRLPSLFSPSSKKQWKQAPTLNGRPYVVGHVPRSPSYREVEFEGLLRGGNATKVITLGSKNARASTRIHSTISTGLPDEGSASNNTRLAGLPPIPPTPQASASAESPLGAPVPGSKSEDLHGSAVSPIKKSRFRLPGGIPVPSPGGGRKAGMVPAEYSTVDFETRLASYSDDEYNGGDRTAAGEAAKQSRRESKDDAWVDILVGTQNRRMAAQDAEMRREGAGGQEGGEMDRRRGIRVRTSDPELDLASLEVARALAAVRERSLSPPTDDERRGGGGAGGEHGVMEPISDVDVDEVETVPRTSGQTVSVEDSVASDYSQGFEGGFNGLDQLHGSEGERMGGRETGLSKRHIARQQRRLGYFDLHPERRPGGYGSVDEDPRDRLAQSESDDDEGDDEGGRDDDDDDDDDEREEERVYSRPPVVPSKTKITTGPTVSPSSKYSAVKGKGLPSSPGAVSSPEMELPAFDERREEERRRNEREPSKVDSMVLPRGGDYDGNGNGIIPKSKVAGAGATNAASGTTVGTSSKTAALIEMYRERERERERGTPSPKPGGNTGGGSGGSASSQVPASRLPVRVGSLGKEGQPMPGLPASPLIPTAAKGGKGPGPGTGGGGGVQRDGLLLDTDDVPRVIKEDGGRSSPARYVHGAPLHNVMEEEEEI